MSSNVEERIEDCITELQNVAATIRKKTTPKLIKELAYLLTIFSAHCWDLYRMQESTEVKYKIGLKKAIDKLVQKWLSYNKAENEVEVLMLKDYTNSKKAASDYKAALLIKESYINFMWAAKIELSSDSNAEIMGNVFSNIKD